MTLDADTLRQVARDYEIRSASHEERGDVVTATQWATVAVTLYELAKLAEPVEEAA